MPADEVKAAAARLGRIEVKDEGASGEFRSMRVLMLHPQFEILFSLRDGRTLTAAEIWIPRPGPEDITVRFRGIDVFRTPALRLVGLLREAGLGVREELPDQWTVRGLSLGFNRDPVGDDFPEDDDGEPLYIQSIVTGPADYYDSVPVD